MVSSDRGVALVLILRGFSWGSKKPRLVLQGITHIRVPSINNSPSPVWESRSDCMWWGLRAIGYPLPASSNLGLTLRPMGRVYTCGFRSRGSSIPDSPMISLRFHPRTRNHRLCTVWQWDLPPLLSHREVRIEEGHKAKSRVLNLLPLSWLPLEAGAH